MCSSTVVKELPETSMWHGAISEEDVQLVRKRHQEKVEEWLDFADFAAELFKLHEKYGIDKGEEGYFAYRQHLRTNYYQKLQTYGPTPDPLDEGCDCIFCKMHAQDSPSGEQEPAEEKNSDSQPECRNDRQSNSSGKPLAQPQGPHSTHYASTVKDWLTHQKKIEPAPIDETVTQDDSVGGAAPERGRDICSQERPVFSVVRPDRRNSSTPRYKERAPQPTTGALNRVPCRPSGDSNWRDHRERKKCRLSPAVGYD